MPDGHDVTRPILGNVPTAVVVCFYIAAFVACGLAALAFAARFRAYRRSKAVRSPRRSVLEGAASVLVYLTFHKQLLRDRYAGMAHLLTFYGFFILFVGTCLVAAEDYGQKLLGVEHVFYHGRFYLVASLVLDLGGVALALGLVMFLARRSRNTTPRILRRWWVGALSVLLLLVGLSGFLLEAARIARDLPAFERWSLVGYGTALSLRSVGIHGDAAARLHRNLWIVHAALCVGFFSLLPWQFFGHIAYGAMSWASRTDRPRAQLRTPDPLAAPGATRWEELGWHDLLQVDACTTCGRCNAACPAEAAGKPLHPRSVVLGLRAALNAGTGAAIAGPGGLHAYVSDEAIWSCTTCGACNDACPVGIEVYDKIVELRRGRVEAGDVPLPAENVFESIAERSNPFGKPNADRMRWAAGMDTPVVREGEAIELLYWVGCAGSFDPEGQGVSRAMIRILNHLKVNYRILGTNERCTGDPARRMGEEGLFQEQAADNLKRFAEHGVARVLTHCPHCFNTFKNEYRELGGRFEVEHHSQFLARMIQSGSLKLPDADGEAGGRVTFHDPCYLGRGNGETQAPRDVLEALPGTDLLEMERSGQASFCCGAGGGSMWLDVPGQTRVENLRAVEAAATRASTVATACPFCKVMLKAGTQALGSGTAAPQVKDLAELIVEAYSLS